MRTKKEILNWILESSSSKDTNVALLEVLIDIRDILEIIKIKT